MQQAQKPPPTQASTPTLTCASCQPHTVVLIPTLDRSRHSWEKGVLSRVPSTASQPDCGAETDCRGLGGGWGRDRSAVLLGTPGE